MLANRKRGSTNRMKATIWTPTMKSEIDGTPDDVIPYAFYSLETIERREKALKTLQAIHEKLSKADPADS